MEGRMEGWKDGRMEGKTEGWKAGSLVPQPGAPKGPADIHTHVFAGAMFKVQVIPVDIHIHMFPSVYVIRSGWPRAGR